MQLIPDVVKYEKPRGRYPLGFSKHNDFRGIIMSEYIVVHGIRIAKDFTPETFGRLTTVGPRFMLPVGTGRKRRPKQVCQCACGNMSVACHNGLVSGKSRSCGCLQKEFTANINKNHGMCKAPEYRVWQAMKDRCYRKNSLDYPDYGGRGITVCDRWLEPDGQGFINFLADMGPRPSRKHSIERDDVNGNYCPENCRWATIEEQARNRRTNVNLTYNGKTQCLTDWSKETGLSHSTLRNRMKAGWSVEKILTHPAKSNAKKLARHVQIHSD